MRRKNVAGATSVCAIGERFVRNGKFMRRVAETEALYLPFIRPIIVVSAHVLPQGLLADEHALALILTTLEKHLDIYRVSGTKYCLVFVIIRLVVDFLIFINDSRSKRLIGHISTNHGRKLVNFK